MQRAAGIAAVERRHCRAERDVWRLAVLEHRRQRLTRVRPSLLGLGTLGEIQPRRRAGAVRRQVSQRHPAIGRRSPSAFKRGHGASCGDEHRRREELRANHIALRQWRRRQCVGRRLFEVRRVDQRLAPGRGGLLPLPQRRTRLRDLELDVARAAEGYARSRQDRVRAYGLTGLQQLARVFAVCRRVLGRFLNPTFECLALLWLASQRLQAPQLHGTVDRLLREGANQGVQRNEQRVRDLEFGIHALESEERAHTGGREQGPAEFRGGLAILSRALEIHRAVEGGGIGRRLRGRPLRTKSGYRGEERQHPERRPPHPVPRFRATWH